MRRKPSRLLALSSLAAAAFLVVAAVQAANNNWPQWRGPDATGAVADANPPLEWSESKNIKWKVKLPGRGSSTPIVWQDKIFIQTAVNTGKKAEQPAKEKEEEAKKAASTDSISPRNTFVAQREDTKRDEPKKDDAKTESKSDAPKGDAQKSDEPRAVAVSAKAIAAVQAVVAPVARAAVVADEAADSAVVRRRPKCINSFCCALIAPPARHCGRKSPARNCRTKVTMATMVSLRIRRPPMANT